MLKILLQAPRTLKYLLFVSADILFSVFSVFAAFKLTGSWDSFIVDDKYYWIPLVLAPFILIPSLYKNELYKAITRFVGFPTVVSLLKASAFASILWGLTLIAFWQPDRGLAVTVIYSVFLTSSVIGVRVVVRWLLTSAFSGFQKSKNVRRYVIYGACDAGRELGRSMLDNPHYDLVGFVDEDVSLSGRHILGVPIFSPNELPNFVNQYYVSDVLLAFNKESQIKRASLVSSLQALNVRVRSLPMMSDLVSGSISLADIHDVDIDDLLGRPVVDMDRQNVARLIKGEVVLVTGAGGSIGSELCKQILDHQPKILILFEWNEYALYNVHKELMGHMARMFGGSDYQVPRLLPRVIPLLGSVTDYDRLRQVMKTWLPSCVFHAAAYKHVPLVEHNIRDGVLNNVFGTVKTAISAIEFGVQNFVLVSTDKAVRPTNIMGATKRIAEMCLQALAQEEMVSFALEGKSSNSFVNNTHFDIVRFGNVLGSSGSVVPLFKEQIDQGGPVTVTHPDVTRFFMSIPEAAQLVLQASALHLKDYSGRSSQAAVYILNMGEPIKIVDLAKKMIELYGNTIKDESNPEGDIAIKFTGLRPGEKLFEELLLGVDPLPTTHDRIYKSSEPSLAWSYMKEHLNEILDIVSDDDVSKLRVLFQEIVNGYVPNGKNVDFISAERDLK